jgi:cell division protein FtsW (lipid II flippase)
VAEQRESKLLAAAGLFLFLFAATLMLSPAAREHSWSVGLRTSQWAGLTIWAAAFLLGHHLVSRYLPDRDPYLLPIAGLLSGWGVLTVYRLDPGLGIRQAVWLVISLAALVLIVRRSDGLTLLRRYKYVLLAAGLLLTSLTLVLGTNPAGAGPRLWLGCCGVYLQPSEPLKLLLVAYLAAYLADQASIRTGIFPLLLPTLLVTGLALVLLLVQRDLGTASIFILLPAVMLYLATDKRRVLLATAGALVLAAMVGFFFIDVVHARLEAWINPWTDPSGHSYQIIQSLLAIANGGVLGRGPGLGSPTLVPVAQSDFIFAAISEETGLVGTIGLLTAYAIWLLRGATIAVRASDRYHRLLAAGLTSYIGIQAILIIGGNLRLLPLTGVTLPFVAYGGSSLLTSFVATALLLTISADTRLKPAPLRSPRPYSVVAALLTLGLIAAAATQAWWAVVRNSDLLSRTDNPRRSIADRYVKRGSLLDRNNGPIDITVGDSGSFQRNYLYPDLAAISGYTHPVYGQAGLEASLDTYLRGLQGNPASLVWWDQLLYGTPPAGLDVRLSIDLGLQRQADQSLGTLQGAVVLLNARSGEILAMASHPSYDPNQLDEIGSALATERDAPLLNRATQGSYILGSASGPLLQAAGLTPTAQGQALALYQRLGFYTSPGLRMQVSSAMRPGDPQLLRISPLQMAVAAASLSNEGTRPAPRIALAVNTPQQGWVVLPALQTPQTVLDSSSANSTAVELTVKQETYWEYLAVSQAAGNFVTWYIAGTIPNWQGTPVAIAVLIEGNDARAAQVGRQVLHAALNP